MIWGWLVILIISAVLITGIIIIESLLGSGEIWKTKKTRCGIKILKYLQYIRRKQFWPNAYQRQRKNQPRSNLVGQSRNEPGLCLLLVLWTLSLYLISGGDFVLPYAKFFLYGKQQHCYIRAFPYFLVHPLKPLVLASEGRIFFSAKAQQESRLSSVFSLRLLFSPWMLVE